MGSWRAGVGCGAGSNRPEALRVMLLPGSRVTFATEGSVQVALIVGKYL